MADTEQSGATPDDAPDPGTGATPDGRSDKGATPDTPLGDAGERALDKERTARREAERVAAEARRRISELEDAGKSEVERAVAQLKRATTELDEHRERVKELEGQIAARDLAELKRQVAGEFELPAKLATRLEGTDLRSLRADAKAMSEDLAAGTPSGQIGVGRGGAGTPRRVDMNTLIRGAAGR